VEHSGRQGKPCRPFASERINETPALRRPVRYGDGDRSEEPMTWSQTGPWTLTIEDWPILTVIFAFQIDIIADGGEAGHCTIRLGGALNCTTPTGRPTSWTPNSSHGMSSRQCSPCGTTRRSLNVTNDASLVARFATRRTISAEADGRPYEHWEVTMPYGKLIALPGRSDDGVAVFGGA
jgi:hypothetical protein